MVLDRMRGGSYNRVVGVTLTAKNARYVLRVPRTKKDEQLSRIAQIDITEDIAPLLFVKSAGIPCAEIISFQRDPMNALGLPYMMQSRVKGECMLQPVRTGSLTHAQRRRVAKEMGQIYNKMLRTTSTVPGRIILPAGEISSTPTAEDLLIAPYGSQESLPWKQLAEANATAQPYNPGPVAAERRNTHIAEFLFALIEDRKRATPAHNKNHHFIYDKWDKWVAKMQTDGLFDDMDYCLDHRDLWPRNIMVDVDASEEEPMVTILDWDQAMLLPAFTMCIPPTWVWDLDNCREPEQPDADADPIDPLKRELKLIFEENAGRNYVRYAKELDYKLGRKVMKDILRGWP
ncbi:phosphotransferase enzyme family-domain-containing protein [Rhypophila decipiens]|uniref:Phosphotransferase enzyme family-domain-containing protein n=1 Tax=Rhypophila decipiens TaxID=261697 RepID=A0AAN7B5T0_9PEZI|nr:phosphotransferase enzyme family-domain-containing protein [Rhypophila decipiens]